MEWYIYPAVIIAGFLAGFINTIAFSGSLITLPLLIFLGLPANIANGTNRVAILMQTAVGVGTFRQEKQLKLKKGFILAIPAILGAIIGAQIAINLDENLLRKTIGALMAVMLIILIIKPKRWLEGRPELNNRKNLSLSQIAAFFAVGLYGGFIQAGVGIFLLAALVFTAGFDLVKANGVKNLIILCFTAFAIVVFIFNDQVVWEIGLILGVGNMIGARAAAKMAIKKGAVFIRWLLIAILVISSAMLLGLEDII
jgi:uncharacterized membrane protein YfcA